MTLGIAWGMAQFLQSADERFSAKPLNRIAMTQIVAVATVLKYRGEPETKVILEELAGVSPLKILVIDNQGLELLGRPLPGDRELTSDLQRIVDAPDGSRYRVTAQAPFRSGVSRPVWRALPIGLFNRDPWLFYLRLGIAVVVSGVVCFWLAWYLAKPVRRLREASRRLSEGDLDIRVAQAMGRRRDEIADLGKDFDWMAERLQALIASQKQLLNDISHELRSPLARLQVAVGLTRKKIGSQVVEEMDRIEREIDRMDDLVGQVLTLARLEVRQPDVGEDYIDLVEFLKTILEDVEYEAANQGRHVRFVTRASGTLKVNAELLRRAMENIIRNAVRYTSNGTLVEVDLDVDPPERAGWIRISVCDRGPGVEEDQLDRIFEPFARISDARDRTSGGYGLGLAIAKRAIIHHGGQVSAYNREGHGLCVEIVLPME
ncbi:MAG: ATP-binding protein [Candidatus Thiodiazotropha sp.]